MRCAGCTGPRWRRRCPATTLPPSWTWPAAGCTWPLSTSCSAGGLPICTTGSTRPRTSSLPPAPNTPCCTGTCTTSSCCWPAPMWACSTSTSPPSATRPWTWRTCSPTFSCAPSRVGAAASGPASVAPPCSRGTGTGRGTGSAGSRPTGPPPRCGWCASTPSGPRTRQRPPSCSPLRPDQPGLVGNHHHLRPVPQVELREDAADVGLHRLLGHEQVLGDLGVRPAAGDPGHHLELALGERGEQPVVAPRCLWPGDVVGDQRPGDLRGEESFAVGHHPDRMDELLG